MKKFVLDREEERVRGGDANFLALVLGSRSIVFSLFMALIFPIKEELGSSTSGGGKC